MSCTKKELLLAADRAEEYPPGVNTTDWTPIVSVNKGMADQAYGERYFNLPVGRDLLRKLGSYG